MIPFIGEQLTVMESQFKCDYCLLSLSLSLILFLTSVIYIVVYFKRGTPSYSSSVRPDEGQIGLDATAHT